MLGVLVLLGVVAVGWCVAVGGRCLSVSAVSVWCLLNSFGCHAF